MNPIYEFQCQVALVTVASTGIGLATVKAFAEAGAGVVLADIKEDALRIATDELTSSGHQAIRVTCDVADESQVTPWSSTPLPPTVGWTWPSTTPASSVSRAT
jgi:NAD(P)-dependent dehydrogenase (short-subunit alcohol dehydrogenase family)